MNEAQQKANALSYKERYKRYRKYMAARNNLYVMTYKNWLRYGATMGVPADCRPGHGREPWQL